MPMPVSETSRTIRRPRLVMVDRAAPLNLHPEPFSRQVVAHDFGDIGLVFDYQDSLAAHGTSVAARNGEISTVAEDNSVEIKAVTESE